MVLARISKTSSSASAPKPGDRILIFKPQWLQLVLSGQKTMEVRGAAYKSGKYFFGTGGSLFFQKKKEATLNMCGLGRQVSSTPKPTSATHSGLKT
jgi:hypothetical protein